MIKNVSKIILFTLSWIITIICVFKVISVNKIVHSVQSSYDTCIQEKAEAETQHKESIELKDAEKEELQTRVKELEEEVSNLKKN